MPRLSRISPDQAAPKARKSFDAFIKEPRRVPNLFRTVAHRSEIRATTTDHYLNGITTGLISR